MLIPWKFLQRAKRMTTKPLDKEDKNDDVELHLKGTYAVCKRLKNGRYSHYCYGSFGHIDSHCADNCFIDLARAGCPQTMLHSRTSKRLLRCSPTKKRRVLPHVLFRRPNNWWCKASAYITHRWPSVGTGSIGVMSTVNYHSHTSVRTLLSAVHHFGGCTRCFGELSSLKRLAKGIAKLLQRLTFGQYRRSLPQQRRLRSISEYFGTKTTPIGWSVDTSVDRPGLKCIGRDYGGDERFAGWKDPGYSEIIGKHVYTLNDAISSPDASNDDPVTSLIFERDVVLSAKKIYDEKPKSTIQLFHPFGESPVVCARTFDITSIDIRGFHGIFKWLIKNAELDPLVTPLFDVFFEFLHVNAVQTLFLTIYLREKLQMSTDTHYSHSYWILLAALFLIHVAGVLVLIAAIFQYFLLAEAGDSEEQLQSALCSPGLSKTYGTEKRVMCEINGSVESSAHYCGFNHIHETYKGALPRYKTDTDYDELVQNTE
ncbi:hypothetical protein CLF_101349 [Clonorchis sinensis]|uniref:Uncharacterized protein n=1 Tax=Clonorchis sinensis TaxID=79923 RepID=G7Y5J8_CLOSI|nr:hypothetical protein CLF_101349 [Clonorchis sinensis]